MDISIIIVNYNSWVVLSDCIESILNLNSTLNTEIIVVDNKSTNDLFLQTIDKFVKSMCLKSETLHANFKH